jgi:hypothetical protein
MQINKQVEELYIKIYGEESWHHFVEKKGGELGDKDTICFLEGVTLIIEELERQVPVQ